MARITRARPCHRRHRHRKDVQQADAVDVVELARRALCDHPFLAARVDEEQILLPIVEEAEIATAVVGFSGDRR